MDFAISSTPMTINSGRAPLAGGGAHAARGLSNASASNQRSGAKSRDKPMSLAQKKALEKEQKQATLQQQQQSQQSKPIPLAQKKAMERQQQQSAEQQQQFQQQQQVQQQQLQQQQVQQQKIQQEQPTQIFASVNTDPPASQFKLAPDAEGEGANGSRSGPRPQRKAKGCRRAKVWSYEAEDEYRVQNVGWRNLEEYIEKYGEPERWGGEYNFISVVRVKDNGFWTYWGKKRECADKYLARIKIFTYED